MGDRGRRGENQRPPAYDAIVDTLVLPSVGRASRLAARWTSDSVRAGLAARPTTGRCRSFPHRMPLREDRAKVMTLRRSFGSGERYPPKRPSRRRVKAVVPPRGHLRRSGRRDGGRVSVHRPDAAKTPVPFCTPIPITPRISLAQSRGTGGADRVSGPRCRQPRCFHALSRMNVSDAAGENVIFEQEIESFDSAAGTLSPGTHGGHLRPRNEPADSAVGD